MNSFMREIANMEQLKMAQVELRHRIELKEIELEIHVQSIKELLNPLTYINYAVSKVAVLEQLVASFMKGYTTIKDLIAQYRSKNSGQQTVKNDIPDNNQQ